MAKITFKSKVQTVYNPDDSVAWQYVAVPKIDRKHCDMNAFRSSRKFGGFANSDMFPAMIARGLKEVGVAKEIRLDRIPAGVTVDTSGFLASLQIYCPVRMIYVDCY